MVSLSPPSHHSLILSFTNILGLCMEKLVCWREVGGEGRKEGKKGGKEERKERGKERNKCWMRQREGRLEGRTEIRNEETTNLKCVEYRSDIEMKDK